MADWRVAQWWAHIEGTRMNSGPAIRKKNED
jgi:hypothetical protein